MSDYGKVNIHTEWGELKEVIVGSILNFSDIKLDDSFFLLLFREC